MYSSSAIPQSAGIRHTCPCPALAYFELTVYSICFCSLSTFVVRFSWWVIMKGSVCFVRNYWLLNLRRLLQKLWKSVRQCLNIAKTNRASENHVRRMTIWNFPMMHREMLHTMRNATSGLQRSKSRQIFLKPLNSFALSSQTLIRKFLPRWIAQLIFLQLQPTLLTHLLTSKNFCC